jgi:ECF sigma factor
VPFFAGSREVSGQGRSVPELSLVERDASITRLLVRWSEGNPAALEDLTPQVQRELHALAKSYLRRGRPNQTLQPTALVAVFGSLQGCFVTGLGLLYL